MTRKSDRFGAEPFENRMEEEKIDRRFDNSDLDPTDIERNLRMDYKNELWVDLTHKPDDMVYHWVCVDIRGEPNTDAISSRRRLGWTCVPRSRHPEFTNFLDDGSEKVEGIIKIKGSVLMQRHIRYHEMAVKKSEEDNFKAMETVIAMERIGANSVIPISNSGSINFGYANAKKSFN